MSQSPQTGQFNSYKMLGFKSVEDYESQSPQTGQFNSYDEVFMFLAIASVILSQSPQTGQFNSYRI